MTSNNETLRRTAGISFRRACLNIEGVWKLCTPADVESGAHWYDKAGGVVADIVALTGDTRETVAAVIAHDSPRTTWQRNVAGAYALLATGEKAPGIMAGNHSRAVSAMETGRAGGDPLATIKGPKTRNFAMNILGCRESVTVDAWAARIALKPDWTRGETADVERILSRAGAYDAVANAYRVVAARLGIDPTTLQASTWIRARNGRVT